MDQDFHYYGTYYAARQGGFNTEDATLIAKAANFIDFFSESTYAAYWKLVSDTQPSSNYHVVASMDNPRYTFQMGLASVTASPEDGLWCSYHFTPGNYDDPPRTPTREAVHGQEVAQFLPAFQKRDTDQGRALMAKYYPRATLDFNHGNMLNRPQSALSRQLITDAICCATDDVRLGYILQYASGGNTIRLDPDCLRRFRLILLGVRAHVIADTWAHQDFNGLNSVLNTYWDADYDPTSWDPAKMGYGRQSVYFNDGTPGGWKHYVLSGASSYVGWGSHNLEAAPNDTSYVGHGWAGHLPDFSFAKFRYKPCWADARQAPIERDNPQQYRCAWTELVSLFNQSAGRGKLKLDKEFQAALQKAGQAIDWPCHLESNINGRRSSANAWQEIFGDPPHFRINVDLEPDPLAVLDGMIEFTNAGDRYGTDFVNINSDLYLFQIAADYHFHFVKHYLERHGIYRFTGSWSQQTSALAPGITSVFEQ